MPGVGHRRSVDSPTGRVLGLPQNHEAVATFCTKLGGEVIIKLPDEHIAKFQALQAGTYTRLVKGRKNIGIVIAILNQFIEGGRTAVSTREVEGAVLELGYDTHWSRDEDRKDDNGLVKALGDLMGAHRDSLRLEKCKVDKQPGYTLPNQQIDDEWLRTCGLDPATCTHDAVAVKQYEGDVPPTAREDEPSPVL